jgi:hypothetical protein
MKRIILVLQSCRFVQLRQRFPIASFSLSPFPLFSPAARQTKCFVAPWSWLRRAALLAGAGLPLAAASAAPSFRAVEIDAQVQIGYGLAVADVNGDRRPDILLADKHLIVWYENPSWKKHVMAERLTTLDHVCLAAADLDGDGRCEVAAGAGWNPGDTVNSGALFHLAPPADRAQRWTPAPLPHEPTVHRIRWMKRADGRLDLLSVPLHGRGNKDGAGAGVKIFALRKPATPDAPWTTELLDDSLHKTHNFDLVQWDADPAHEVLVAGREGLFLLDETGGRWQRTQLGTNDLGGAGEVRAGQLASGKRFLAAIEPMHGNTLALYRPGADGGGAMWQRQVLDETLVDGHALACGDLAGLGRDQIVAGWRAMNRPGVKVGIKLYTPTDATGSEWKQSLLDDNTMACEDLMLADFNGDGRLDLVAAGRATKNLKVYFNEPSK